MAQVLSATLETAADNKSRLDDDAVVEIEHQAAGCGGLAACAPQQQISASIPMARGLAQDAWTPRF